jgi:hypothetical protein
MPFSKKMTHGATPEPKYRVCGAGLTSADRSGNPNDAARGRPLPVHCCQFGSSDPPLAHERLLVRGTVPLWTKHAAVFVDSPD